MAFVAASRATSPTRQSRLIPSGRRRQRVKDLPTEIEAAPNALESNLSPPSPAPSMASFSKPTSSIFGGLSSPFSKATRPIISPHAALDSTDRKNPGVFPQDKKSYEQLKKRQELLDSEYDRLQRLRSSRGSDDSQGIDGVRHALQRAIGDASEVVSATSAPETTRTERNGTTPLTSTAEESISELLCTASAELFERHAVALNELFASFTRNRNQRVSHLVLRLTYHQLLASKAMPSSLDSPIGCTRVATQRACL